MSEEIKSKAGNTLNQAYHRFGNLMNELVKATNENDKARIVHLSESISEHTEDVISFFYASGGVSTGDIEKLASSSSVDQTLIRLAAKPDDDGFMRRRSEVDSRRD